MSDMQIHEDKDKYKDKYKMLKDPSHAIFLTSREFKDIKYDTNSDG